jgi:VWFA-related protein
MARLLKKISYSVKLFLVAVVILIINGSNLLPQSDPQKTVTIRTETKVVNVYATVRDKRGAYVKDLMQEDFALKEDNRKQPISNFTREVNLPLTIGVILDYSPSMQAVAAQLQIASVAFFNSMIRPGIDQVFIIKFRDIQNPGRMMSFDGQIELLQDLTSDPAAIARAANLIAWEGVGGQTWDAEFQTMLADSVIYSGIQKFMMLPPSRKALIVIGDGYHVGNHMDAAVKTAQEADTQVYTIHIYDPNFGASSSGGGAFSGGRFGGGGGFGGMMGGMSIPGQQSDTVWATNLQELSLKTGGTYFEYSGKKSLDQIYKDIEEELRSYYSIGYSPDEANKNPGCRKLKVTVQQKELTVHSRESYCPPGTSTGKKSPSINK